VEFHVRLCVLEVRAAFCSYAHHEQSLLGLDWGRETAGDGADGDRLHRDAAEIDVLDIHGGEVRDYGAAPRPATKQAAVFGAAINGDAGQVHDRPTQVFDDVIRINLRSVWLGLKYLIPQLVSAGGGSIVTVGSVAALRGAPGLGAYAASKHGVVGLTQTVALEYAKSRIRANIVCPGSMDTPLIKPMLALRGNGDEAEGERQTVSGIPNGRLAKPSELAATAIWLLLDAPTHLTGQSIVVDGGRTAM
jgi:NAD(P)-dependent dehydrogenase (short-subunit alcohol dehydrogenase family)